MTILHSGISNGCYGSETAHQTHLVREQILAKDNGINEKFPQLSGDSRVNINLGVSEFMKIATF